MGKNQITMLGKFCSSTVCSYFIILNGEGIKSLLEFHVVLLTWNLTSILDDDKSMSQLFDTKLPPL